MEDFDGTFVRLAVVIVVVAVVLVVVVVAFVIPTVVVIGMVQLSPVQNSVQLQLNHPLSVNGVQVPLFWQGMEAHSSKSQRINFALSY